MRLNIQTSFFWIAHCTFKAFIMSVRMSFSGAPFQTDLKWTQLAHASRHTVNWERSWPLRFVGPWELFWAADTVPQAATCSEFAGRGSWKILGPGSWAPAGLCVLRSHWWHVHHVLPQHRRPPTMSLVVLEVSACSKGVFSHHCGQVRAHAGKWLCLYK